MRKIDAEIEQFKRTALAGRLEQITERQRGMFDRLFPQSVIPEDRLMTAIDLCDKTILKNSRAPHSGETP